MCVQVMQMAMPPKKRRHTSSTCSISGQKLGIEDGLEILKGKSEKSLRHSSRKQDHKREKTTRNADIVVHYRFTHFFSMLWLVCRLDHILRNVARAWMDSANGSDSATNPSHNGSNILLEEKNHEVHGIGLCQKFSEKNAQRIESMGIMFLHAVSHVQKSLLAISNK